MRYDCEDLYPWVANTPEPYYYWEPYYTDTDIRPGINSTFGRQNWRGPFSCGADRSRDPDAPEPYWYGYYGYEYPYYYYDTPDNTPGELTTALFQNWSAVESSSLAMILPDNDSVADALAERGINVEASILAMLESYEADGWRFVLIDAEYANADGPLPEVVIDFVPHDATAIRLPLRLQGLHQESVQTAIFSVSGWTSGRLDLGNYHREAAIPMCMWDGEASGFQVFANEFLQIPADDTLQGWRAETSELLTSSTAEPWGWNSEDSAWLTRGRTTTHDLVPADPILLFDANAAGNVEIVKYLDDLEVNFPICGSGWASNPGDCDDDMMLSPPPPSGAQTLLLAPLGAALLWLRRRRQR